MTKSDKNNNELSDTDKKLWRGVTRDVKPLAGRKPGGRADTESGSAAAEKGKKSPKRRPRSTQPVRKAAPPSPPGGMDARTARRLKQGKLEIESTLDLHGMTQADAHAALKRRVRDCYENGKRTLLVITGKGYRSAEPGGVLRRMLPQWINEPPLNVLVLSAQPAQPKHGGDGAFYVRIRRKRV